MTPDDPRHGTNAGFLAHRKAQQNPCGPCVAARNRYNKAARIDAERGQPRMVTLGTWAHEILTTTPRDQLAQATGIGTHRLCRYIAGGPSKRIHRTTRNRIIAAATHQFWTPIGIQRRLQALNAVGYSMEALGPQLNMWPSALRNLANKQRLHYVQRSTAAAIIDAFDRLCMDPTPPGKSGTRARNDAARKGWHGPLSWVRIDDPDEVPAARADADGPGHTHVDDARITRILNGDFTLAREATNAERHIIVARWPGTLAELERRTGWKPDRYTPGDAA